MSDKLITRANTINGKFDSDGHKLPAILIHKKTHKEGGTKGVHNIGLQEEALKEIKLANKEEGGVRTVIYDTENERLRASIKSQHFQSFIQRMYNLVKDGRPMDQVIKENENETIIKVGEGNPKATKKIGEDLFEKFAKGVTKKVAVKDEKRKILKLINEVADKSFKDTLSNSLDVLKSAMKNHEELEGDSKVRNNALKEVLKEYGKIMLFTK